MGSNRRVRRIDFDHYRSIATFADQSGEEDPNATAAGVQMPEDLTALTAEELSELEDALVAEFDRIYDSASAPGANPTAVLAELATLGEQINAVRAQTATVETAAEEAAAAIADLANQVHPPDPEEGGGDPADAADGAPAPDAAPAPQPVAAAAARRPLPRTTPPRSRPSAGQIANRTTRPAVPGRRSNGTAGRLVITASADVPGFAGSQELDKGDVATAMHARASALSDDSHTRFSVCTIERPIAEDAWLDHIAEDNEATLERVIGNRDATALVASGGWCTPSIPMYNFFNITDADELIDLPSTGIVRGGMLTPSFYGFGDVGAGALWNWTEAMDIAVNALITNKALTSNVATFTTSVDHGYVVGQTVRIAIGDPVFDGNRVVTSVPSSTTFTAAITHANVTSAAVDGGTAMGQKSCLKIPCPTWTDHRLEAEGLCVTHGNLSDKSFPEMTRNYVDLVMSAHEHRMSAAKIAKIVADALTTTVTATTTTDAAGDILSALGLEAADYRSQYRAARTRVVDVAFPNWAREAIRATLAMRHSEWEYLTVTDAQIDAMFALRNIRAQFVSDYGPLYTGSPIAAWPTTIPFVMYFAGAYVLGQGGKIELSVVRDSTLNATNDHTAAWSEEFFQVARLGPQARKVNLAINVNGITGIAGAG